MVVFPKNKLKMKKGGARRPRKRGSVAPEKALHPRSETVESVALGRRGDPIAKAVSRLKAAVWEARGSSMETPTAAAAFASEARSMAATYERASVRDAAAQIELNYLLPRQ